MSSTPYKLTNWHNVLKRFLFELFYEKIIPAGTMTKKQVAELLLSINAMKVWGEAMTPVIYSISDNLETDEFLGDAASALALRKLLIEDGYDESEGSAISQSINSKEHQWKATVFLGLDKVIRKRYPEQYINNGVRTDIYEAFIGACDKVGNLTKKKFGEDLCNFAVKYVYVNVFRPIILDDPGATGGSSKTQITQLLSRFGLGTPTLSSRRMKSGVWLSSLTFDSRQMNFLTSMGVPILSPYIAKDVPGNTEGASAGRAYSVARLYLDKEYGVNPKWSTKIKTMQELSLLDRDVWEAVMAKSQSDGYVSIYFDQPKKLFDSVQITLLLIGTTPEGKDENIQDYTYFFSPEEKTKVAMQDKGFKRDIERVLRKELILKYLQVGKYPEDF